MVTSAPIIAYLLAIQCQLAASLHMSNIHTRMMKTVQSAVNSQSSLLYSHITMLSASDERKAIMKLRRRSSTSLKASSSSGQWESDSFSYVIFPDLSIRTERNDINQSTSSFSINLLSVDEIDVLLLSCSEVVFLSLLRSYFVCLHLHFHLYRMMKM